MPTTRPKMPDPTDDCNVLLYTECEFCYGLFPRNMIGMHVMVGHEFELSRAVSVLDIRRRLFACTPVVDDDFDGLDEDVARTVPVQHRQYRNPESGLDSDGAGDDGEAQANANDSDWKPGSSGSSKRKGRRPMKRAAAIIAAADIKQEGESDAESTPEKKKRKAVKPKPKPKATKPKASPKKPKPGTSNGVPANLPNIDEFPEIARCFNTKIVGTHDETMELETSIKDKFDVKEWMNEYKERSGSEWIFRKIHHKKSKVSKLLLYYACRYTSRARHRTNQFSELNRNCNMQLRFNIKYDGVCTVAIIGSHNHVDFDPSRRRPADETKRQFESYIRAGLRPPQARAHHEKLLRARPEFREEMLQDTSVMPTPRQISNIYDKYKKQHPESARLLQDCYLPLHVDVKDEERIRVAQETAKMFEVYIKDGMRPREAMLHHERVLRARPDFAQNWLSDSAYMPTRKQVEYFIDKFKMKRKKSSWKSGMSQKFADKNDDYAPEFEDESILEHGEGHENVNLTF